MSDIVRTHVLLPRELLTRIDERVGPRRRSEFVAETLRKEMDRTHLLDLAEAAAAESRRLGRGGGPPEWETPEGTLAWVRAQREIVSERGAAIAAEEEVVWDAISSPPTS